MFNQPHTKNCRTTSSLLHGKIAQWKAAFNQQFVSGAIRTYVIHSCQGGYGGLIGFFGRGSLVHPRVHPACCRHAADVFLVMINLVFNWGEHLGTY